MSAIEAATNIINSTKDNLLYLNNHFCESVLSEDAKELDKKISEIRESEDFNISKLSELICQLESCDFSEDTQNLYINKIFSEFAGYNSSLVEHEDLCVENFAILEYSGNSSKNNDYIKTLSQMEKYLHDLNDDLNDIFKMGEDIINILEDCAKDLDNKKLDDLKKATNKIKVMFDKYNEINNKAKWKDDQDNYNKFVRQSLSFNNIFSTVTLAEKKIIDDKLDKAIAELYNGDIKKWVKFAEISNPTPSYDKLNNCYLELKNIDRDYTVSELGKILTTYMNYLIHKWKNACAFCYTVRKKLNLEIEDKLSWKIVHKIFK